MAGIRPLMIERVRLSFFGIYPVGHPRVGQDRCTVLAEKAGTACHESGNYPCNERYCQNSQRGESIRTPTLQYSSA